MAIVGIGVDVVDIARVRALRARHGERFYDMVFFPGEVEYCLGRANADECFAARFAAKEAAMKALGTGWARGVGFRGVEVVREGGGAPLLRLHGGALERSRELGVAAVHLSLSHSREVAIAQVVMEGK